MLLIPAIDLKDGQCVRLKQGRMEDVTVFSDAPVEMARHWHLSGCRRLHIVDLDGAFAGAPRNKEIIGEIIGSLPGLSIQVGGGIRSLDMIEQYLQVGVDQVILGTRAVEDPPFLEEAASNFPSKVILGLDARDGQVATDGWDVTSDTSAVAFAQWAGSLDIAGIVFTDIERDGMLKGVNVASTLELAEATAVPVIASGGISSLEDVAALKAAFKNSKGQLLGAITGRAIYEGTLDLQAGQALFDAPA